MNDRELLELAAKAAGYAGMVFTRFALMEDRTGYPEALYSDEVGYWNPLTDDGDALRLAVKLELAVRLMEKCVFVESEPETLLGQSSVSELEMYGRPPDPYAATRRAIVRAAAEIGRNMK